MSRFHSFFRLLLEDFEGYWRALMTQQIQTGRTPTDNQWTTLEKSADRLAKLTDISSAASLRFRATGEKAVIPPAAKGVPAIDRILDANPALSAQAKLTHPLAQWRVKRWAEVERNYAENLKKREDMLRRNEPLADHLLTFRQRRFRRDCLAEVANTAEQVALSAPGIGELFPFSVYHSREDGRVRPTHATMNNFIALRQWGGWSFCRPAAGWNCRCFVRHLTRREAEQAGYLDGSGRPKFLLRWPNASAQANYERGIPFHGNPDPHAVPKALRLAVFPDPGVWMMPRYTAESEMGLAAVA